jgi:branched-chain amino acid transport system permease protein
VTVRAIPSFRVERTTPRGRVALAVGLLGVALLASLPAWGNAGQMKLLVEVFTLLALAESWNLLAGYAGLVSIGQQAFIGLGAYGLFVAADRLGLPPLFAVVLATAAGTLVAAVTSLFAFRLQGGYFAIGTWVIAEVARLGIGNAKEVGSGTGVTIQTMVHMAAADRQAMTYWLALGLGVGSVILAAIIMRSRLGLALRAVRDSEVAARSLGVDVFRAKLSIYLISSAVAAAAGAVIYMQLIRIQPNAAFSVDWTAKMIFIVVIGGLGRIEGPIVGTVLFFALQETLADYGSLYLVILGATAIVMTLIAPRGLWGLVVARRPMAPFGVRRRLLVNDPDARLDRREEMVE